MNINQIARSVNAGSPRRRTSGRHGSSLRAGL
ncbi:MAG: hypothetical protein ACLRWQ_15780 [Flavonifractor plautii]